MIRIRSIDGISSYFELTLDRHTIDLPRREAILLRDGLTKALGSTAKMAQNFSAGNGENGN